MMIGKEVSVLRDSSQRIDNAPRHLDLSQACSAPLSKGVSTCFSLVFVEYFAAVLDRPIPFPVEEYLF